VHSPNVVLPWRYSEVPATVRDRTVDDKPPLHICVITPALNLPDRRRTAPLWNRREYADLVELGVGAGKAWFGILGPLAAGVEGGQRLDLGGRKQRELLALLLLNLNQSIPAPRIADALWRGQPPASADVTLRSHVSHLRRRLAGIGAGEALVTKQAGYGLFANPDQVDSAQFERLVESGCDALNLGDTERAAQLLTEALDKWRGSVLDDLGPPEFAQADAARLDGLG
jgi:serine/threonine-protein kinase PknK